MYQMNKDKELKRTWKRNFKKKKKKKKKKWKRNLTKNLEGESVKTQEKGLNLQRNQNYRVNHDQFEKKK